MKKQLKKFLQFNGKYIVFLSIEGQYWVALKPICEAIGVDYNRIFKNIKSDRRFNQLLAKQPMTGADSKTYLMLSLPERFVYGWLMTINSDNELLLKYQIECCDILYNHFHGTITQHIRLLEERSELLNDLELCKESLAENPDYLRILEIQKALKNNGHALKKADMIKVKQLQLEFSN